MLSKLKKNLFAKGIYVFPCNRCGKQLMMLHVPKCQGCGSSNLFFEAELSARHSISESDTSTAVAQIKEIINPEDILVP